MLLKQFNNLMNDWKVYFPFAPEPYLEPCRG